MNHTESLLFALQLDGRGGGSDMSLEEILRVENTPRWLHFDAGAAGTAKLIKRCAKGIDQATVDAMLDRDARPRVIEIDGHVQLTLRGVNLNDNEQAEDMVAIRLWISPDRIISVRYRMLKTVQDIAARLRAGKGPKDVGSIVSLLCSRVLERIDPVLGQLDDDTDNIEERLIDSVDSTLRKNITEVRKKAILFRRYIAPQREAIGKLRLVEVDWLSTQNRRSLQESHDRVTRYVEDLDAIRERAQIVKDELVNILSDKLNRNLYVISVVTAIFLPLGFLTGLFGINIGGMPGVENPSAFWQFAAALSVLVIIQIILFKVFKWF